MEPYTSEEGMPVGAHHQQIREKYLPNLQSYRYVYLEIWEEIGHRLTINQYLVINYEVFWFTKFHNDLHLNTQILDYLDL